MTVDSLLRLDQLSESERALLEAALEVAQRAYAPYSRYAVGAALRASSGRIYLGCNVENASYEATICAERSAVMQMVAAGDRSISALAVYTPEPPLGMPCGVCRQVISEFCSNATVLVGGPHGALRREFAALLPEAFGLSPSPSAGNG